MVLYLALLLKNLLFRKIRCFPSCGMYYRGRTAADAVLPAAMPSTGGGQRRGAARQMSGRRQCLHPGDEYHIGGGTVQEAPQVAFVHCSGTCEAASDRFQYHGVLSCREAAMLPGGGPEGLCLWVPRVWRLRTGLSFRRYSCDTGSCGCRRVKL